MIKAIVISFLLMTSSALAAEMLKPLDTAVNGVTGNGVNEKRTSSGIMRSNDPCDRPRLKLMARCKQPRYKVRRDGVIYRNGRVVEEKQ